MFRYAINVRAPGALAIWLMASCCLLTIADQPQKFQTSDEEMVDPFRDEKAKVTVLVFVRKDCPISNRYATELRRIQAKFAGQTVWWLVYPDGDVAPKEVREHKKEYKLEIQALLDPHHELVKLAAARVTPEAAVFLAGKKLAYRGRIDDRFVSFGNYRSEATRHDLEEALTDVVNGKPVRVPETRAVGCTISSEP